MAMGEKEVLKLCMCAACPSFVKCDEKLGFCLARKGKSICIIKERGCLCPACPVRDKEILIHVFYCTRGSEPEQKR